jgi:hypothetical protein
MISRRTLRLFTLALLGAALSACHFHGGGWGHGHGHHHHHHRHCR